MLHDLIHVNLTKPNGIAKIEVRERERAEHVTPENIRRQITKR
jgi:hypothetical protein